MNESVNVNYGCYCAFYTNELMQTSVYVHVSANIGCEEHILLLYKWTDGFAAGEKLQIEPD